MNYYEIIGFITGFACVYLNTRQNIWAWPIAMVSVLMYAYVFWNVQLYADMGLQLFFFVLNIYGLFQWLKKGKGNAEYVAYKNPPWKNLVSFSVITFLTGFLYGLLDKYTDSDVPFLDAVTTALSIVAQYLLAKKRIENWLIWIVANVIYVGLFIYKELYLTSFLYVLFILLAIKGYIEWKKLLK